MIYRSPAIGAAAIPSDGAVSAPSGSKAGAKRDGLPTSDKSSGLSASIVPQTQQEGNIRVRLLHKENTVASNLCDVYGSHLADKKSTQASKDNAYDRLLKAVEDNDEKMREFNNEAVVGALAETLQRKITIRKGNNLERDLSGDYLGRVGDVQRGDSGGHSTIRGYGRIEQKNKELFDEIRQDIRGRSIRDALLRGSGIYCCRRTDKMGEGLRAVVPRCLFLWIFYTKN